jgi:hypothetical protein
MSFLADGSIPWLWCAQIVQQATAAKNTAPPKGRKQTERQIERGRANSKEK